MDTNESNISIYEFPFVGASQSFLCASYKTLKQCGLNYRKMVLVNCTRFIVLFCVFQKVVKRLFCFLFLQRICTYLYLFTYISLGTQVIKLNNTKPYYNSYEKWFDHIYYDRRRNVTLLKEKYTQIVQNLNQSTLLTKEKNNRQEYQYL